MDMEFQGSPNSMFQAVGMGARFGRKGRRKENPPSVVPCAVQSPKHFNRGLRISANKWKSGPHVRSKGDPGWGCLKGTTKSDTAIREYWWRALWPVVPLLNQGEEGTLEKAHAHLGVRFLRVPVCTV